MGLLLPIPPFWMLCDRERGDSMLWERGSSESIKVGQAEQEAAPALEFGGLELLPWHQPSWQRAPSPARQGRAYTELVLCHRARAGRSWARALGTLVSACIGLCGLSDPAPSAWAQLLLPELAEQANVNSFR